MNSRNDDAFGGSSLALDDELAMLKDLEVNFTCPECFGVYRGEDADCWLETLQSCGHAFCIHCINERLEKIPLPLKQSQKSQFLGSDPRTAARRLAMLVAIRCSTCLKLSKHPLLYRDQPFSWQEHDSAVSSAPGTLRSKSPGDMSHSSYCDSAMSTSSSTYSSAPNMLTTDRLAEMLDQSQIDQDSLGKSIILKSSSQLQLFAPNSKLQIFVKDLFGRTSVVTIDGEQSMAELKKKLARLFRMPVADLQVRFFESTQTDDQTATPNTREHRSLFENGLFDQATVRIINSQPTAGSWWRPVYTSATAASAGLWSGSPFKTQKVPLFESDICQ